MSLRTVLLATLLSTAVSGEARELWVYCATNLQVDANVDVVGGLLGRAGKAGYRRMVLADSKLARLGTVPPRYFENARRLLEVAAGAGVRIVPALFGVGYSEGLLFHDPNLAEALPARDVEFVVGGGIATAVACRQALTEPEWKDELWTTERDGWRCLDPAGQNARVVFRVKVKPWHSYHLALTVETKAFEGEPRAQVLVDGKGLLFSNLGCKATQSPTRHHAVFNTFEHAEVLIYLGAWGPGRGELAISDPLLEVAGLVNLVRREGAPFEVKRADGKQLVEGKDFEPVSDPLMGKNPWPGAFDVWHEPPPIRTKLPDSTRLLVSFHHAVTVHDGQMMICPSEPRTKELLKDEARRVRDLFGADAFFLSHDEIRVLNQDQSCRRRKLDAGKLLADHVRDCTKIVKAIAPAAELWIWSDMFDPSHNAHADYYLVRGDLAGAWEGLDRSIGIAQWNFDQRAASLAFFADRGHRQVIAGYYDGPVEQVKEWLAAADRVKGVTAVMYTTWQGRYDDLERFAELVTAK